MACTENHAGKAKKSEQVAGEPQPWKLQLPSGTWVVVYKGDETCYCMIANEGVDPRTMVVHSKQRPKGTTEAVPAEKIMDVLTVQEVHRARGEGWPDREPCLYMSVPAGVRPASTPVGLLLVRVTESMCRRMMSAERQEMLPAFDAQLVDLRKGHKGIPRGIVDRWKQYICETAPPTWHQFAALPLCEDVLYVVSQRPQGPRWEGSGWCTANLPWDSVAYMFGKIQQCRV